MESSKNFDFLCEKSRCTIDKIRQIEKQSKIDQEKMWEELRIDDFQANIVKIVVNYLQVLAVITDYDFDWPNQVEDVTSVTQKFIPTDKDSFSIDCILSLGNLSRNYLNMLSSR